MKTLTLALVLCCFGLTTEAGLKRINAAPDKPVSYSGPRCPTWPFCLTK